MSFLKNKIFLRKEANRNERNTVKRLSPIRYDVTMPAVQSTSSTEQKYRFKRTVGRIFNDRVQLKNTGRQGSLWRFLYLSACEVREIHVTFLRKNKLTIFSS